MKFKKRDFPDGVIYARVDQVISYQDYSPFNLCVRLIGVDSQSFEIATFNGPSGCQTFLIDINLRLGAGAAALEQFIPGISGTDFQIGQTLAKEIISKGATSWLEVSYSVGRNGITDTYGYALFQDAAPTYLNIKKIRWVKGTAVCPPDTDSALASISLTSPSSEELLAFHVGQGMCSVLQCDNWSYLIDAGAGTPVKREAYTSQAHLHGSAFTNQLRSSLGEKVLMILSHPDSDHWRLLDWDSKILRKIDRIFIPDNVADIALADKTLKPKLVPTKSLSVRDRNGTIILEACRSKPAFSDKNGECLVTVARVGNRKALLPGDYVYERMCQDSEAVISAMQKLKFDAVVVPHHGDRKSSLAIVAPKIPHKSIAFFSAGNHLGYHHPRSESLTSHHETHFKVISKKWIDDIVAAKLL